MKVKQLIHSGWHEEVLKTTPVYSYTPNGTMRTRFRAFVAVGDKAGEFGLEQLIKKTRERAITGATGKAYRKKFRIIRGSWKHGNVNTVPFQVRAKCGHVEVVKNPAPPGVGLDGPAVARCVLRLEGIKDGVLTVKGDHHRYLMNVLCALHKCMYQLNVEFYNV